MTKSKHGGRREGSGRKALLIPKKAITVKLDRAEIDRLNKICKDRKTSQAKQITKWIKES